jgi:ABC-type transport system involved in multi-copper enzyme maturation permease subunit
MFLNNNPVLQRELLFNLRKRRAFALLAVYLGLLGGVVYLAWPEQQRLDMTNSAAAKDLVNIFFLGQYVLASLMAPSFAAGAISGEKERKTYEMLLASPLRPGAIVIGKLMASLCHLAILVFASLPIVMLCLPLGGVSMYEVLAAYFGLIISVCTFGMLSLACSSYFKRTAAALVVSYLLVLPLVLLGILAWIGLEGSPEARLFLTLTFLPAGCGALVTVLFLRTSRRLLHPPDVGSGGEDVVDLEGESKQAVGLYIRRDQFPDRLFVPAKRTDLMADGINPVYDKELRSDLFSQGTLMVRVVIQISLLVSFPLIAVCLFWYPQWAPWYVSYALLFTVLVGPVFLAGSVTGERERQTLDLLLTTTVSPWQILWGKLITGLRVTGVLTSFVLWPLLLACVMVPAFWPNLGAMAGYLIIVVLACLTTAILALFCSVVFKKTVTSLMVTYILLVVLFFLPPASAAFAEMFLGDASTTGVLATGITSPFSAAFALPLDVGAADVPARVGSMRIFIGHLVFTLLGNIGLLVAMMWLFGSRWRVAG